MWSRLSRGRNLGLLAVVLIAAGAGLAVHFASCLQLARSQHGRRPLLAARLAGRPAQRRGRRDRQPEPAHASPAADPAALSRPHDRTPARGRGAADRLRHRVRPADRRTRRRSPAGSGERGRPGRVRHLADIAHGPDAGARRQRQRGEHGRPRGRLGPPRRRRRRAAPHRSPRSTGCPRSRPSSRTSCSATRSRRRSSKAGGSTSADRPGRSRTCPSLTVLDGHFDPAAMRGKVVVVGATAPVLQDVHATAAGSLMSGPEVQANAIATALADFPLRSPSEAVTLLLIVALAALAPGRGAAPRHARGRPHGPRRAWSSTRSPPSSPSTPGWCSSTPPRSTALVVGTGGSVIRGMWFDSARAPPAADAVRRRRTEGRGAGAARARPAASRAHRDHRRLPDRGPDRQRRHGDRLPRHPARARPSGGGQADHPRARPGSRVPRALQGRVEDRRLDRAPERDPRVRGRRGRRPAVHLDAPRGRHRPRAAARPTPGRSSRGGRRA